MTDTRNAYLVKVTIRNNLILRQMKKLGIKTQTELARLAGLPISTVGMLIGMKKRPQHALTGEWLDTAFALSAALHVEPEDLWTEKQRGMALDSNSREVSMSEDAVMQLASGRDAQDMVQKMLTTEKVDAVLQTLNDREQQIISDRIYADQTFKEIGERMGVSANHVNQLYRKAIRKLKHPSRSKPLRDLIQGE
jgi:RNA polymerase sigma factor (sigma-70 family)